MAILPEGITPVACGICGDVAPKNVPITAIPELMAASKGFSMEGVTNAALPARTSTERSV